MLAEIRNQSSSEETIEGPKAEHFMEITLLWEPPYNENLDL